MSKYLDMVIRMFGFEHPYTISIAKAIENNVSEDTIKKTVLGLIQMQAL